MQKEKGQKIRNDLQNATQKTNTCATRTPLNTPLYKTYQKYFILIACLVFTIFEQCILTLGNG